ncbi:MAG TPA: zinc ribbon domain-containing protein [Rectinemataceae bacterium]|nr:zinc ribbon domain-containing protein [Rectinemataceae bacterium]
MKRPRYYCERCGTEVKRDARFCPRCGRFFSSVKCPHCGYVGEADDFSLGCPVCGYADAANAAPEPIGRPAEGAQSLPWWSYPLAALLLLGLVILLFNAAR